MSEWIEDISHVDYYAEPYAMVHRKGQAWMTWSSSGGQRSGVYKDDLYLSEFMHKEIKRMARMSFEDFIYSEQYAITTDDSIVYIFKHDQGLYQKCMEHWRDENPDADVDYLGSLMHDRDELAETLKKLDKMIAEAQHDN